MKKFLQKNRSFIGIRSTYEADGGLLPQAGLIRHAYTYYTFRVY